MINGHHSWYHEQLYAVVLQQYGLPEIQKQYFAILYHSIFILITAFIIVVKEQQE